MRRCARTFQKIGGKDERNFKLLGLGKLGPRWARYCADYDGYLPGEGQNPYAVADRIVDLAQRGIIKRIGFYDGDNNDCLSHLFNHRSTLNLESIMDENDPQLINSAFDGTFHVVFGNTDTKRRCRHGVPIHDIVKATYRHEIAQYNVYGFLDAAVYPDEVDALLEEFALYLRKRLPDIPMFVVSGDKSMVFSHAEKFRLERLNRKYSPLSHKLAVNGNALEVNLYPDGVTQFEIPKMGTSAYTQYIKEKRTQLRDIGVGITLDDDLIVVDDTLADDPIAKPGAVEL